MANSILTDQGLVKVNGTVGMFPVNDAGAYGYTVKELLLNESILNPGLQTIATIQSDIYMPGKNLDSFKNTQMSLNLSSGNGSMSVNQKIYRLDNREFMPINTGPTEEFSLHACDQSLLNDAKSLVSKSWKCESPDKIVKYVLQSCAGVRNLDVQSSQP